MRHARLAGCLVLLAIALCGCAKLEYFGISPSARTFHEDPGFEEFYIGADLEFFVTDPVQERRLAEASLDLAAGSDTADPANPPLPWEQFLAIDEAPVEQARTSAEPPSAD
jgi:hypothetical protein